MSVMPGKEEARLVYLGVASGAHLRTARRCSSISAAEAPEIIIGDQETIPTWTA